MDFFCYEKILTSIISKNFSTLKQKILELEKKLYYNKQRIKI